MRPTFPDSAVVHAREALMLRGGRWTRTAVKVRWGLFDHPVHGPVLIDTGYGPSVTTGATRSLALRLYAALFGPHLHDEGTVEPVLARRGLTTRDVRWIIVTHFHADHVGELKRFPNARFVADLAAWRRIRTNPTWANLRHGIFTELVPPDFEARAIDIADLPIRPAPLGLPDGHDVFGDGTVLAIPLPGHAEGHFGVCFPREAPPLLYAADTQWLLPALAEGRAPGFPAALIATDRSAAAASTAQVDAFRRAGGTVVLCHDPARTSHDAEEGER